MDYKRNDQVITVVFVILSKYSRIQIIGEISFRFGEQSKIFCHIKDETLVPVHTVSDANG